MKKAFLAKLFLNQDFPNNHFNLSCGLKEPIMIYTIDQYSNLSNPNVLNLSIFAFSYMETLFQTIFKSNMCILFKSEIVIENSKLTITAILVYWENSHK